jgi:molecular chaperone GrpE (heat shock protein)
VTVPDDDVRSAPDGDGGGHSPAGQSPAADTSPGVSPGEASPAEPAPRWTDAPAAEAPAATSAPALTDPAAPGATAPIGEVLTANDAPAATEARAATEVPAVEASPVEPSPAKPSPVEPSPAKPQQSEPTPAEPAPAEPAPAASAPELAAILAGLTSLGSRMDELAEAAAELARLRNRDTELIARLHDDVTRLRTGEISAALNPVVAGMIKLHDQMVSLGALNDPDSPVGMLHTQLLQTMELTCAVKPFSPAAGERFDASRHTGIRRIPTTDASADGTIAGTVRAGFARADGSVVRVAEVEVHRLAG